ncbi:uncharacterized protein LOC6578079 isoform X1 [Drosophila mojavensis]|uniref:Uncharacterized protein n=1 Tax=Drosophila mojavensis TaxID=7230 RepID=B4KIE6_DROMO|nr:uncharacterized protein LOC6578079 isoform X1 [Drosophila mojavensis]EDW13443.1 uncharacterized protein Dmoj_GI18213 [Drosophila mojavensis]
MAFRATSSAIVIDSLIAELVQEVISDRRLLTKDSNHIEIGPCEKLFEVLGITQCGRQGADDNVKIQAAHLESKMAHESIDATAPTDPSTGYPANEPNQKWHSWLEQALAADCSEDELEIYRKQQKSIKESTHIACQTEQPRIRKRNQVPIETFGARQLRGAPAAPCEMSRQTIYIDTMSTPTPSMQTRPPLADRFCYMLTDFASALYCSLAIMCCCTPSMFR